MVDDQTVVSGSLVPLVVIPLGLAANAVYAQRLSSRYDYECSSCGQKSVMGPWALTFAPHRPVEQKYVRCPACRQFQWMRPIAKA